MLPTRGPPPPRCGRNIGVAGDPPRCWNRLVGKLKTTATGAATATVHTITGVGTGGSIHFFCWNRLFFLLGSARFFAAIQRRRSICFARTTFFLLEPCFCLLEQCNFGFAGHAILLCETMPFFILLEPCVVFAFAGTILFVCCNYTFLVFVGRHCIVKP